MISTRTIILLVALIVVSTDAMSFDFDSFSKQMAKMAEDLKKMGEKMTNESIEMTKDMENFEKMDARNLTLKIQQNDTMVYLGGCFCKNFECECCGFIDQLSENSSKIFKLICFFRTINYVEF